MITMPRLTLLALSIYLPRATAFVPPAVSQWRTKSAATPDTWQHLLFAAANATTTTTTPSFDVLFQADPTVNAPLPPSYTECPFTGIFAGPKSFYRQASTALEAPKVFSFLDKKNQPTCEIRGGKVVRDVLRQEFSALDSNAVVGISQIACGPNSLRTARSKQEHRAIRQLVGVPLSPRAVESSIPLLQAIGRAKIQGHIVADKEFVAWDLGLEYELDITEQQLLGLNLETEEEIANFHHQVHNWLKGMWYKEGAPDFEACMKARAYLRDKIDQKINILLEAGESDESTVGDLVFATIDDVEDTTDQDRTLSRQEVIDNVLFLMLAGTETTATSMANVMLLMGLHPSKWQAVVEEQADIVARNGDQLTPAVLEQACPYLEAVIHETMRIMPFTLVSKRVTTETIVVDGIHIPKGWAVGYNMYLTHAQDTTMEEGHMDLLKGFKPERWLKADTRPGKEYIPFGAGPRKCPGNIAALTQMKTFLSLLAREMPRFELVDVDYNPNQPIEEQIRWNKVSSSVTPEDGVRFRMLSK